MNGGRVSWYPSLRRKKGDVQDCRSYRGIKLLFHIMKAWERILEERLRMKVEVSRGQFSFMPGQGTMNPIFILSQ